MPFPYSRQTLRILLACFGLLTVATWFHRYPTGDDAWFAEQGYWLAKTGVIRSEFFRGILGWEQQILVSHKLFLLWNAALITLFGHGLPTVQFTGIVWLAAMSALLVCYVQRRENATLPGAALAILVLIFANAMLIRLSFENRPELMVATFGFGSFLLLQRSERSGWLPAGAGALAALAMLTHLNGIVYLATGGLTLLLLRRWTDAVTFGLVGALVGALYFVDAALVPGGFATWQFQFFHDPATQQAFGLTAKLRVMSRYWNIFFQSPEMGALSGLFLFFLWHQRRYVRAMPQTLKIYSATLFVAFWLITKDSSGSYLPLFMPFMLAVMYELFRPAARRARPFRNLSAGAPGRRAVAFHVLLLAYGVIGVVGALQIMQKNVALGWIPDTYRQFQMQLPTGSRGFVPLTFFFNEYERYPRSLCHENYFISTRKSGDRSGDVAQPDSLFMPVQTWAAQRKLDFMVFDYIYNPETFAPPPGQKEVSPYRLVYFDGRFGVYRK